MELGNLMFNTNKNQQYECPRWIVALLNELDNQLHRVMWNIHLSLIHISEPTRH